jgi:hypothetical protein
MVHENVKTPFQVLNVPETASSKIIRQQYLELCKQWHPDKTDAPEAKAQFQEIQKAYKLLSDPGKRQLYLTHGVGWESDIPKWHGHAVWSTTKLNTRRSVAGGFALALAVLCYMHLDRPDIPLVKPPSGFAHNKWEGSHGSFRRWSQDN